MTDTHQQCDSIGCTEPAAEALRFRDQRGHVHDCRRHVAELREHADVVESAALPCPWPHNGRVWTDVPVALQ